MTVYPQDQELIVVSVGLLARVIHPRNSALTAAHRDPSADLPVLKATVYECGQTQQAPV